MNNYRNEVKWAPFESLYKTSEILEELEQNQRKCAKPVLSEDELHIIEQNILSASHTKETILIEYYFNGCIFTKKGKISSIRKNDLKIFFQDQTSLYFEQILSVTSL